MSEKVLRKKRSDVYSYLQESKFAKSSNFWDYVRMKIVVTGGPKKVVKMKILFFN